MRSIWIKRRKAPAHEHEPRKLRWCNFLDAVSICGGVALIIFGLAYKGKPDPAVHFRTACGPTVYQDFWATNPTVTRYYLTNVVAIRTYSGTFAIRTRDEKLATNIIIHGQRNEKRD